MVKPISPRLHGATDYAFLAMFACVPRLLKQPGPLIKAFTAMGLAQTTLNAVTDQPYAACRLIPFRVHGRIEKASAPLYILWPLAEGVWQDWRSRNYFLAVGAVLVLAYNLTDWNAAETHGRKGCDCRRCRSRSAVRIETGEAATGHQERPRQTFIAVPEANRRR